MSTDVHQIITNKIIAALEANTAGVWTCPWYRPCGGLPVNAVTGKPYRGINIVALWAAATERGYDNQRWATYRQWSELGAQVRRGEKGTLIVFFKQVAAQFENEEKRVGSDRRLVARASFVFNAAQVNGASRLRPLERAFDPVDEAERLIVKSCIPIEHGGTQPCYIPGRDLVRLPLQEQFISRDGYYATAFHELSHATGHKSRLHRDLTGRFGTEAYAMEELVAELSSDFVMASLGLSPEPHADTVLYLADWLKVLCSDKRAIFTAASAASQAAAYLTRADADAAPRLVTTGQLARGSLGTRVWRDDKPGGSEDDSKASAAPTVPYQVDERNQLGPRTLHH